MSNYNAIMDAVCTVILLCMWYNTNMRVERLKEEVTHMGFDIKDLRMELEQYE